MPNTSDNAPTIALFNIIVSEGFYVSPGFIDTHVHGGGGHDFMDGGTECVKGAICEGYDADIVIFDEDIMIKKVLVSKNNLTKLYDKK